jgi:hypothetical protein
MVSRELFEIHRKRLNRMIKNNLFKYTNYVESICIWASRLIYSTPDIEVKINILTISKKSIKDYCQSNIIDTNQKYVTYMNKYLDENNKELLKEYLKLL